MVPEYALLGPRKIAGRKFFVLVRRETFAWERANAFLFYQLFVPVAVWDQRAFFQLEQARGLEGYLQELKKNGGMMCVEDKKAFFQLA